MRLRTKATPTEVYDVWRCTASPCDHEEQRVADHWAHVDCKELVRSTTNYIIYITHDLSIGYDTTPELDKSIVAELSSAIFSEGVALEARARQDLDEETRTQLLSLIGSAYACCYDSNFDGARSLIDSSRRFLLERSEEISRGWYLSASFAAAAILAIAGLIAWYCRAFLESQGIGRPLLWLFLSAVAGGTGALLSVILRSGQLNVAPSVGRWLHYLEGGSRIAAGALSGMITWLAIQSGLFLGGFKESKSSSVVLLVAMAAGASERLATSIIAKIDSDNNKRPLGGASGRGGRGSGGGRGGGGGAAPARTPTATAPTTAPSARTISAKARASAKPPAIVS
jgi:hypothetical protein